MEAYGAGSRLDWRFTVQAVDFIGGSRCRQSTKLEVYSAGSRLNWTLTVQAVDLMVASPERCDAVLLLRAVRDALGASRSVCERGNMRSLVVA